jgi:methyltransferase (TIGR00027 family)
MQTPDGAIHHVSDTALWVAYYRAEESERPDALFHDPYAQALVGEKGKKIAARMTSSSRYTAWSVPIRTHVIDHYIADLVRGGIDMVLNLGAGLDTRPYRMPLPDSLLWVEVDYPHMVDHKEAMLAKEAPKCRLERVRLDLADRGKRKELLAALANRGKKALVLTEGVIPYLSEEQVSGLAEDLHQHGSFRYWIAEYIAPQAYRFLQSRKRARQMRNAPFRFYPADWLGFFQQRGWRKQEIKFLLDESLKVNRVPPRPWWLALVSWFADKDKLRERMRFMAYVLLERS